MVQPLGHAIDFHVGLATYHRSFLPAKSETKCRRNRIENFFRNPALYTAIGEFEVCKEERRLRVRSVPGGSRKLLSGRRTTE